MISIEISHINNKVPQPYKIRSCVVYIQIVSTTNRVDSSSFLTLLVCLLDFLIFLMPRKPTSGFRRVDFIEDKLFWFGVKRLNSSIFYVWPSLCVSPFRFHRHLLPTLPSESTSGKSGRLQYRRVDRSDSIRRHFYPCFLAVFS